MENDKRRRDRNTGTKYVVDTCVFNWLTDASLTENSLPNDGGFAITHVQMDEINETKDTERRARLLLMLASLNCKLLLTQTFVFDVSRYDFARWSDGELFASLKAELDSLNGNKKNNARDALIAETAIANGCTLLTADAHLKVATEKYGGKVFFFPRPPKSQQAKVGR